MAWVGLDRVVPPARATSAVARGGGARHGTVADAFFFCNPPTLERFSAAAEPRHGFERSSSRFETRRKGVTRRLALAFRATGSAPSTPRHGAHRDHQRAGSGMTRTRPCDASRSPPDARGASPTAGSPEPFSPLSAGSEQRPLPTDPARLPDGTPAPRARARPPAIRARPPGAASGGSSWSSGQQSSPAAPRRRARGRECLARVRALAAPSSRRRRRRATPHEATTRAPASRDARRERARRDSADARATRSPGWYVAKFKEDTPRVAIPTRARARTRPRAARGATVGHDFSGKKRSPVARASGPNESPCCWRRRWYVDIDALFREAPRACRLGDDADEARADDELAFCDETLVPTARRKTTLTPTAVFRTYKNHALGAYVYAVTRTEPRRRRRRRHRVFSHYVRASRLEGERHGDHERRTTPDDNDDDLRDARSPASRNDTKFRKRCPMHEGPCAAVRGRGAACRFRRTRARARAARDDPLCARCRVARKEHRKAATDALRQAARGNARVTQTRTNVDRDATERAALNFFLKKHSFIHWVTIVPSRADRPPGPRTLRRDVRRSHDCCVISMKIASQSRPRARPGGPLSAPTLLCGALMVASSPRSEPSSRRLCSSARAWACPSARGSISTHPQSCLKNDAARRRSSSRSSTPRSGRWSVAPTWRPCREGDRQEVSRDARPRDPQVAFGEEGRDVDVSEATRKGDVKGSFPDAR